MSKAVFLVLLFVVLFFPIYLVFLKSPPPLPEFDYNAYWGPEEQKGKQDTRIRPFKISFSELEVRDLKDRLKIRRPFTPPLENIGFEYGFNTKAIESWLQYWEKQYNFKAREEFLNQYPQFKTNIQGLDVHFIRVTPKVPQGVKLVPVLLLHGWPGSVREFYEAVPHLTAVSKDREFALELIIPSLPGYGYSSGSTKPGFGPPEIAIVLRNLMHRLGFKKFYVQGGDWGAIIGSNIATIFPKEVLGYHANMAFSFSTKVTIFNVLGAIYPPLVVDSQYADRMYPLSDYYGKLIEEMGYAHIQATKPDTVSLALADSPSGLLAYILEKFSTWTRSEHRSKPDGGLEFRFSKDQLIDNLMFYWVPKSMTTAMRLYSECFNKRYLGLHLDDIPTPVPTWLAQARHELSYLPPWMMRFKYPNLVNATHLDDGGHFLAFELPEVFSEDVIKAMKSFVDWNKKNNVKTEL